MDTLAVLKEGFAMLYESEAFFDCKIVCGSHHFNLHKSVLGSQSKWFQAALKSGTFKEGETGVIELKATSDDAEHPDDSCDDPEIVKLMIEYFYHFDYLRTPDPASASASVPPKSSLIEHAKVFAMAIKYQADGLRQLATQKFKEAASVDWNHEDFAHTIHVVYNSTADNVQELRSIVATTIHDHLGDLKDKEEIEAVISSLGSLAYSLLKRTITSTACVKGHKSDMLSYDCNQRGCDGSFDICKQCYPSRGPRYCPWCANGATAGP